MIVTCLTRWRTPRLVYSRLRPISCHGHPWRSSLRHPLHQGLAARQRHHLRGATVLVVGLLLGQRHRGTGEGMGIRRRGTPGRMVVMASGDPRASWVSIWGWERGARSPPSLRGRGRWRRVRARFSEGRWSRRASIRGLDPGDIGRSAGGLRPLLVRIEPAHGRAPHE